MQLDSAICDRDVLSSQLLRRNEDLARYLPKAEVSRGINSIMTQTFHNVRFVTSISRALALSVFILSKPEP